MGTASPPPGSWQAQLQQKKLYRPSDRVSQWRAAQLELMRSTLPGATATAMASPGHRGRLPVSQADALRSLSRPPSRNGPIELMGRGIGRPGSSAGRHAGARDGGGAAAPASAQQARPSTGHAASRPHVGSAQGLSRRGYEGAELPPRAPSASPQTRPTTAPSSRPHSNIRPPSASARGVLPDLELDGLGP